MHERVADMHKRTGVAAAAAGQRDNAGQDCNSDGPSQQAQLWLFGTQAAMTRPAATGSVPGR
jgi:hypothetical protein